MFANRKLSPLQLVLLLGALTALDPFSLDIYLPAFANIAHDLNTSINYIELSVTTFFFGMATGQLIYGPLADRFGRRKPLLIGMMIYLISTIGCIFATNIFIFIFCRLMQSLGGCAGMVITRAIARDLYNPKEFAIFFSNISLVMSMGPILAPIIGTLLNHVLGWRAIFWVLALLNIICLLNIWFFLPETNQNTQKKY